MNEGKKRIHVNRLFYRKVIPDSGVTFFFILLGLKLNEKC